MADRFDEGPPKHAASAASEHTTGSMDVSMNHLSKMEVSEAFSDTQHSITSSAASSVGVLESVDPMRDSISLVETGGHTDASDPFGALSDPFGAVSAPLSAPMALPSEVSGGITIGSPLISFSPMATTTTTETAAFAFGSGEESSSQAPVVNDLLSLSPLVISAPSSAPPPPPAMMADFFLDPVSITTPATDGDSSSQLTGTLLSFSPVAQAAPTTASSTPSSDSGFPFSAFSFIQATNSAPSPVAATSPQDSTRSSAEVRSSGGSEASAVLDESEVNDEASSKDGDQEIASTAVEPDDRGSWDAISLNEAGPAPSVETSDVAALSAEGDFSQESPVASQFGENSYLPPSPEDASSGAHVHIGSLPSSFLDKMKDSPVESDQPVSEMNLASKDLPDRTTSVSSDAGSFPSSPVDDVVAPTGIDDGSESTGFDGFATSASHHSWGNVEEKDKEADDAFQCQSVSSVPNSSPAFHAGESSGFEFAMEKQETKASEEETSKEDSGFEFQSFSAGGFSSSTAQDDDFGDFSQSNAADDDDFGDFEAPASSSGWASAQTSFPSDADDGFSDDDGFSSFTPAPAAQQWGSMAMPTATASQSSSTTSSSWSSAPATNTASFPSAAPSSFDELFAAAFPSGKAPVSTSSLPDPTVSPPLARAPVAFIQANDSALQTTFATSLQEYYDIITSAEHELGRGPLQSEALRLKYLKYVLTERLSEASRHDGVFPQGSEKYQLYQSIAESEHEQNMWEALVQLQEALFHSSFNEAMMRIAKQAALSAKARIAEQAAQQQAHARSSLLATTRQFLYRGGTSSTPIPDSMNLREPAGGASSRTSSSGSLTNGAASQKNSRVSSQGSQDTDHSQSSGYGSGEDNGSDGDRSSFSEGDATSGSSPGGVTPSSSRGGGFMKKFQAFTSFSSSRNRPRVVCLRQMGQSSEDVRRMELNMDSINGGFDEVKWRCAVFLYDADEVAHLAPAQIKILSYPGNQPLTGKTDKSILTKFFKPGVIWTIDIGANSNSGVSVE
ncbi:hypothetical protein Poli38472_002448 [Pythium oligandrum]|uniref:Uncharacterized protein n=1 Tax=Pythium oligandrum TaxID=41045 RepID=A0A8K1CJS0_PYTOL|nr:hypothetical protein Poli38472_002448 [Pythium oligandrum]|eukprot:TMW63507.1 hypothetical protein Poli38472_002448 [Pythium oligandrum]